MVYRHRDKQAGGPDHIVFQGGKQIQFHRPSKTPDSARVAGLEFLEHFGQISSELKGSLVLRDSWGGGGEQFQRQPSPD